MTKKKIKRPTYTIAIACIHYPVASGRYAARALRRLGHTVYTIGYSTGKRIWNIDVEERYAWRPDANLTDRLPQRPDLIIIMDSAWAYHHPIYADVPHVVWGVDNHVRNYEQAGVEHYFLAHKAPSVMRMDDSRITWLPCAYDPEYHTPSPLPYDKRPYDVAFVGVPYRERVTAMQQLEKAKLRVYADLGPLFEDYAAIYHKARVALNVSVRDDLNQRIFEGLALGCNVVSNPVDDLTDLDGRGEVYVTETDEIVKTVQQALADGHNKKGQEWVKPHTWDARAGVIVDWYAKHHG